MDTSDNIDRNRTGPEEGRQLARGHSIGSGRPSELGVYGQLDILPGWLEKVRLYCQEPAAGHDRAADWLLDNSYQVTRAIRQLAEDLPRDFYSKLPPLEEPDAAGVPRVFALACAMLERLDPRITMTGLIDYVASYQQVSTLTMAELWALPSMLRLACIERIAYGFSELNPDLEPLFPPSPFVSETRLENPTMVIANALTNLAAVNGIRWELVVERTSRIDAVLAGDPADIYRGMTYETRDLYRNVVEDLAERSGMTEQAVAQKAVKMAGAHRSDRRKGHVGYWLVDAGLAELKSVVGYRASVSQVVSALSRRYARGLYFTAQGLAVLAALVPPALYLSAIEATTLQWLGGILLSLVPATVLGVTIMHWLITLLATPRILPEMDYGEGIPAQYRTAVVIPVILAHEDEVPHIIEKLEVRWLSNPDPALRFVILSDPRDAGTETLPGDAAIETALRDGIRGLNARHAKDDGSPFLLMHRPRSYNPREECWMARERKRGKLEDFNRFVTSGETGAFTLVEGDISRLRDIPFAIVLDIDTDLPPETAARMVGVISHPLSRVQIDGETGRVVAGYSIVQPRVEILADTEKATQFSHLYAGDTAIDIYSRAASDVYQDVFGAGIFVGKGIYDIAAMDTILRGRIPENSILSHDLLEGLLARAALASNIIVYEDYPATYPEYAMRLHRWIRGDWQLLPWLAKSIPNADGDKSASPFSAIDRWKIFDNLRRSLVPPALLFFFVGGWVLLPGSAAIWTLLAVLAPGSYLIGEFFSLLTRGLRRGFVGDAIHKLADSGGRWFMSILFLVSDTFISLDAIFRTLWRMFVSRRFLLEWTSSAQSAAAFRRNAIRASSWRMMWPSSAASAAFAFFLSQHDFAAFLAAAPILFLWILAPEFAARTAQRRVVRREVLNDPDRDFLKSVARRTWYFFETFTGPDDNWLPPDNYQEYPQGKVAHRTSPTNIGMFLTSALSARDLGFITTADLLVRCRNTVATLDQLKSYRGHILNWYDTRTLEPLEPQYVSTVDSGNLAISLISLKSGCADAARVPAVDQRNWDGLLTTLDLLIDAVGRLPLSDPGGLDMCRDRILSAVGAAREHPARWRDAIADLSGGLWQELERVTMEAIDSVDAVPGADLNEIHVWLGAWQRHLHAMERDLDFHLPWMQALSDPPAGQRDLARAVLARLSPATPLSGVQRAAAVCQAQIDAVLEKAEVPDGERAWLETLQTRIAEGTRRQLELAQELSELAETCDRMAYSMDFGFLYDPEMRLFYVGYNDSVGQMDHSHYDLLATEARLASFFAIAKNDVPIKHWYAFSRPITRLGGKPSVLSWNGSMFEYLMPPIYLPSARDTLLGESEVTAVDYQCRYAKERGVPWGISESAFGVTDTDHNYQYRAFGVPGLGLRRGLTEDLVVAPYATALALCAWPATAVDNLRRLSGLGALTCYGYWDALDYTPSRLTERDSFVPVRTYMAHHQGMVMAAIANALKDDVHVHRLLADKKMSAVSLLLQERVPWEVPIEKGRIDESWEAHEKPPSTPPPEPWVPSPDTVAPQLHLLGNGHMTARVSASGAGGLLWNDYALTRWRPDPTRDSHGVWIYLQDAETADLWSVGRQPTGRAGQDHKVVFHQHMVESFRRDNGIATRHEVAITPFDDVEIRRIDLINETDRPRTINVTTYGEVVLEPPLDDERHQAFSKLFVGSSYLADHDALLFERRPRRPETKPPVLLHKLVSDDPGIVLSGFETDRSHFVGRGRTMRDPVGLEGGLTGTTGWTLDPVMALQVQVRLKPMETKSFAFLTIAGSSRHDVLSIAARYPVPYLERAFREAALETSRELHRHRVASEHLPEMQVLSSLLMQSSAAMRRVPKGGVPGWQGQPDLWRFGLSGDLPILLLLADDAEKLDTFEILVRAQTLWRRRGLLPDIVVLQQGQSTYENPLRDRLLSIMNETGTAGLLGRNGGIHLLMSDQLDRVARDGLAAAAHVVLTLDDETLDRKLDRALALVRQYTRFEPTARVAFGTMEPPAVPDGLAFENGYGGFDTGAAEYVIQPRTEIFTPAPWCNVISNAEFGSITSSDGLGCTWSVNSGEHRLTPWSNDPVQNRPGEVVYLRDEATADVWCVTPAPIRQAAACQVRHGLGYTIWRRNSHELEQEMLAFVPDGAPVKLIRLRLKSTSDHVRRITATYYAEWLLGALNSNSTPHVHCWYDASLNAILAQNQWNPEFGQRRAFVTASHPAHGLTGDRNDFLGKYGDVSDPAALRRPDPGGRFTPGGDACAAFQVHLDIKPGQSEEIVFVLGEGADGDTAKELIRRWRDPARVDMALDKLRKVWSARLAPIQVDTPDPAFDVMVNQWLPYQNLSCRIMARGAFYQAGGAFGFRDQLQDVLALLFSDPNRARDQILRAAAHQFEEGDALHWWHAPTGRGVRTRCSDDYLWLAYVTARYVAVTDDLSILDVDIPFLSAPELRPDEGDRYARFDTGATAPLFDHCARALDRMMELGAHGLPLIGTGDWNDGMDRIGDKGAGESVWLAWFQIATVRLFAPLADRTGNKKDGDRWRRYARKIRTAVADAAWDGAWYIRAFDDDGEPWGASRNDECRIDLIAQSWSVLSGDPDADRSHQSLQSAWQHLVDPENRLIRLLDPPFFATTRDPGYIQAYPPGIRENGGQYTHAATWLGLACAQNSDGDRAWQVFDIINPIRRTADEQAAERYLREPYVLAGDVSGSGDLTGQGGWTWYTGAAGWSWQLAVHGILGVNLNLRTVTFDPSLPRDWGGAKIRLQGPNGALSVTIEDPDHRGHGVEKILVDGRVSRTKSIEFPGAGKTREVVVRLGGA